MFTDEEFDCDNFDPSGLNYTARALVLYSNETAVRLDNYLKKKFNRRVNDVSQ